MFLVLARAKIDRSKIALLECQSPTTLTIKLFDNQTICRLTPLSIKLFEYEILWQSNNCLDVGWLPNSLTVKVKLRWYWISINCNCESFLPKMIFALFDWIFSKTSNMKIKFQKWFSGGYPELKKKRWNYSHLKFSTL